MLIVNLFIEIGLMMQACIDFVKGIIEWKKERVQVQSTQDEK